MSYPAYEETVIAMVEIDSGNKIRVARVEGKKEGEYSIDVRRFFTNGEGKDCPTQKGVRVHRSSCVKVITAILEAIDAEDFNEIMDNFW